MASGRQKKFFALIFALAVVVSQPQAVALESQRTPLSLDAYLNQVRSENGAFIAAEKKLEGFKASRREGELFFSPRLEASGQQVSDGAYPNSPGFNYDRIDQKSYSLGVSQEFSFGLQAKLNYQVFRQEFVDASFGTTPVPFQNWNATPKAELSLPLWQNLWGRLSRSNRDIAYSQNDVEMEAARSKKIEMLIQAETAYWRLATARELVRIRNEAHNRAEALLKYVQGKAKLDLSEKSDVLQTQASFEASRLDLRSAVDDQNTAEREFNRIRNAPHNSPIGELAKVDIAIKEARDLPSERPGDRVDVRIAKAELSLTKASAVVRAEANKPELSVFGSYALNGRDERQFGNALSDVNTSNRPSYAYGVKFSMPLNLSASAAAREGAMVRQAAVENDIQHRLYEQDQQWKDLIARHKDAREKLKITEVILETQEAKLTEERRLLKLGRSSLFQVLSFEQDYLRAELGRVQTMYEFLSLKIQSQMYVALGGQS